MPKVALVLSGGGARGAFQFAAEKYAREVRGYEWDIIAGVSVGALNGTMLAMNKADELEQIWRTISNDQVYTGGINFWSILKIMFGAKGLLGNEPLWELLQREAEPGRLSKDLRIGVVSLRTGKYLRFRPGDPGFLRAVLASTANPLCWSPVEITPDLPDMVDGSIRNNSPLGDVLDADPDEVVIINCDPRTVPQRVKPFKNALEIGLAALDLMKNEIFVTDVREFIRINDMVLQAQAQGAVLHKHDGRPYKYYDYRLIEPDEPLSVDTLDFSRDGLNRMMALGWRKAMKVLG